MTARFAALAEIFRTTLDAADRLDPAERDELYRMLVADLTLGPPTDPAAIRDPRARGSAR